MENETFHNVLCKRISFTKPVQPQRKPKASVVLEGGVGGWVQFGEALGTAYLVEFQRQCTTAAMRVFLFCHEGVILLFGTISTAPWPESLSSAFFRRTTGTHGNCSLLFSSSTGLDPQLFQADSESPIRPISRNDGLGLFWDLGLHKGVASCNSCAGRVDSIRDTRSRIFPARSEKKKRSWWFGISSLICCFLIMRIQVKSVLKKHKKTGQLLLLGIGDHLSLKLMILMMIKVRLSSQKPMDAQ